MNIESWGVGVWYFVVHAGPCLMNNLENITTCIFSDAASVHVRQQSERGAGVLSCVLWVVVCQCEVPSQGDSRHANGVDKWREKSRAGGETARGVACSRKARKKHRPLLSCL